MPPYSHSVDGAVQVLAPAAPPAAIVPLPDPRKQQQQQQQQRGHFRRSESSSSFSDADGSSSPRKMNRWAQLRRLVFQLTGLAREVEPDPAMERAPTARRRRARSLGASSPILLLHHDFWLEAIDEKHRYGFHLRAFHKLWKQEMADIAMPLGEHDRNRSFFYWLDHGRGSGIELPNCGRDALDATCVQYCSPQQRRQFEVEFTTASLAFIECHTPVQTDTLSKWIFVLSQDDKLYIARKNKGFFHHSSFLAGVPIVAAGKIYVSNGKISAIEPHSGHFKPKLSSLTALCSVLEARGVDARGVHFIKPKKWKDPWPYEDIGADMATTERDEDYVSDSDDS